MRVEIKKSCLSGTAAAPPSKSISHRYLICAALSEGTSIIENLGTSEDICATADCLEALGAKISIRGGSATVYGFGKYPHPCKTLGCRESGSTLRFIIPISLLSGETAVFSGSTRLLERGIDVYRNLFEPFGIGFGFDERNIKASGKLSHGSFVIPGNISSQYISGLLFALPLTDGDSNIEIIPPLESGSYIGITLDSLKKFGIELEHTDMMEYKVRGGQHFIPTKVKVEGDYSNAAFLYALNSIGNKINITGLNTSSSQGDRVCVQMIESLMHDKPMLDLSDCPDLAPVLFAVAALHNGAKFTGTRRLAIKESNRAVAMAQELEKFGLKVSVEENSVEVFPGTPKTPSVPLCGHNDHRIVMALSIPSILTGAVIEGSEAVNKSYPDYFKTLEALGAEVKYEA